MTSRLAQTARSIAARSIRQSSVVAPSSTTWFMWAITWRLAKTPSSLRRPESPGVPESGRERSSGQVGIGEHAEVEGGTILGGQSGVLSGKILRGKGIVFWGTPARPLKDYLKELATLARLSRRGTK